MGRASRRKELRRSPDRQGAGDQTPDLRSDTPRDPKVKPIEGSRFWISSDPSQTLEHHADDSLLAVRLGLAFNALVAQQRFALSANESAGPAHRRDVVGALVTAAALTHETIDLIRSNFERTMALAALSEEAPEDLLKAVRQLTGGSHAASPLLTFLRNRLGFHWDPTVVRDSLQQFTSHEEVIWVEGQDDTTGEIIFRLSADVLMNALWPEASGHASMTQEERVKYMSDRTEAGLTDIQNAMAIVTKFIHYVLIGFFKKIKPRTHQATEPIS